MNNAVSLKLYTTSHCHLCELAISTLSELGMLEQTNIVEITDVMALLTQYGTQIPVLQRLDNLAELNWPFSALDIQQFLSD